MFTSSPKFEWSFSHLPRFNWSCWTIPKCSWFTQMFLIFPKTWMKFFSWPKFDEGCCNYHTIPVHSRAVSISPSWAKTFWTLFYGWFGNYFTLLGKIDTTSLTCESSCILCPNVENFWPNNGQFFSIGDTTASPYHALMTSTTAVWLNSTQDPSNHWYM